MVLKTSDLEHEAIILITEMKPEERHHSWEECK